MHGGRIGVVALALLALTLAPSAVAQVPSTDCTTIKISHLEISAVAPEATTEVSEAIANSGNFDAQVTVDARVTEGTWKVDRAQASATVPAGQTKSVTFIVTAPARNGGDGKLGLSASGTCTVNGQGAPPGLPVSPTTNTATDTVDLKLGAAGPALDFSRLQNVPPLAIVAVVAAILIVVGAIFAMRRGGRGFVVECPEPAKPLKPGRGVSFPIHLKNKGNSPDTAKFEVGEVPAGWTAFMAVPELQLAAGESRTLYLMVRAPPAAHEGAHIVVPVVVRSKKHEGHEARVNVRADVHADGEGGAGAGPSGVSA